MPQHFSTIAKPGSRTLLAAILFFAVLSVSVISINDNEQLGRMSGLTEEYIDVAKNQLEYGLAYPDDELQFLFRPPGYIVFLRTLLRIPGHIPRVEGQQLSQIIERYKMSKKWETTPVFDFELRLIYFAQAVLFSLSSVIIFLLFTHFISLRLAFLWALAFGLNIYFLILNGVVHYQSLHIFSVLLAGYATFKAFRSDNYSVTLFILSGLLWGMATLIRPTTLILPFFLLAYAFYHFIGAWGRIVKTVGCIILGMVITIFPQTWKNYEATDRLIPVNVQAWSVLWGNTIEPKENDMNSFNWHDRWYPDGMAIYQRVTGEEKYYHLTVVKHNLPLEDAFKAEALDNIKNSPHVYAANTIRNFWLFNVGINSVFVKLFQAIQSKVGTLDMRRLTLPGGSQDFYSPVAQMIFEFLHVFLLILAAAGIYFAFKNREKGILLWVSIYLCFAIGQSLVTITDLMYFYIKMPFLYIFAGYFLAITTQGRTGRSLTSLSGKVAPIIMFSLLALEAVLLVLVM